MKTEIQHKKSYNSTSVKLKYVHYISYIYYI